MFAHSKTIGFCYVKTVICFYGIVPSDIENKSAFSLVQFFVSFLVNSHINFLIFFLYICIVSF